jgi:Flp pilus assembly protein TadG
LEVTLLMSRRPHRGGRGTNADRDERGAAVVEFALVTTFVLLPLLFGLISYGLVFAAQLSMNAAARDAARAGVVQPLNGTALTCQQIATRARDNSATVGLTTTKVAVSVTGPTGTTCSVAAGSTTYAGSPAGQMCLNAPAGGQVSVRLTYAPTSPAPLVPLPSSLGSNGKFQCEYS